MKHVKKLGVLLFIITVLGVFYTAYNLKREYGHKELSNSPVSPRKPGIVQKDTSTPSAVFGNAKLPADPESLTAMLNTSIEIYGQVVDQFGDPVPSANVMLRPINRFQDSYGEREIFTDENGYFSAKGLYGKTLGITVSKDGYLRIPALSSLSSSASLSYTGGDGTGDRHATPSNPLILELLKIGPTEPMIHVGKKRWKLPLDGTPQVIALNTEEGQGVHQIQFRLRSSTHIRELPGNNAYTPFDWSFEIRVPGGGFAWDESDAKFEAPQFGYNETIRYEYPATMPREEWKRLRRGRYFVKFADGTYGRIQFEIDGGSDRKPLNMESWLSLKPGSRNLASENMIIEKMEIKEPEN